jgi:hypothetical protein
MLVVLRKEMGIWKTIRYRMGIKIIKSGEIESLGESISRYSPIPKSKIFLKDGIYYKFWCKPTSAFYILNGLNMEWQSHTTITPLSFGLLTEDTCCAFKDIIQNENGICIGYTTIEGTHISKTDARYESFVDKLVDVSIKTGYGFADANHWNIVDIQGNLSLIDLDFPPIKLNHGLKFSTEEQYLWEEMVDSHNNSDYFLKLKDRYLNSLIS